VNGPREATPVSSRAIQFREDRDVQITLSHVEPLGRPFGMEFTELKAKHGKVVATLLKFTFILIYTPLIHETVSIEYLASRGESR